MPNPLSDYGVSDTDYAMTIGAVMGEAMNEGLVGMGMVAATGLNRAQNARAFGARSAALGDVWSAPHSAGAMLDAIMEGRNLSNKGRQFSSTINSNIPGASTEGFQNFKAGASAALAAAINPELAPTLGIRQDNFERAKVATEVAVKARDMGIDLGFGVTNFGTPSFGRKAGVGRNPGRFGGHVVGPFDMNERPPTPAEFASRFAAAAALTGVVVPDEMVPDITTFTDRAQIMSAASIVQRQAQDFLSQELEQDVMPGLNYNDLVQPTGLSAVDVPDVTGKLGIDPLGPLGFAENFGITPTNDYENVSLPDPLGRVDFAGYLDAPAASFDLDNFSPVDYGPAPDIMSQMDGPTFSDITAGTAFDPLSSIGPVDYGPAPDVMSQFDGPTYPDMTAGLHDAFPSVGVGQPAQYGEEQAFGSYTPSTPGFSAGFDEGPWGATPDFSAPSLEAKNNVDRFEGAMAVRNQSTPTNEDIAANVMAELSPSTPQLSTPSFDPQAAAMGDWADKVSPSSLSTPSVSPQSAPVSAARTSAPAPAKSAPARSAPSRDVDRPAAMGDFGAPSLAPSPDYGSLVDGTYGVGQPLGGFMDAMANPMAAGSYTPGSLTSTHGFEDAMANPSLASSYSSGLLDGWTGTALRGAGWGALQGGIPGAVLGGVVGAFNPFGRASSFASNTFGNLFGGSPDGSMMVSNGHGGWRSADALDAMANPDIARSMFGRDFSLGDLFGGFGSGGLFGGSEGFYGGGTNGPGSSRGDGSYAESAGFSDNNPQGIL